MEETLFFNKVFCISLPRTGTQTIQHAISKLFPNRDVYHSLGNLWHLFDEKKKAIGATECFHPIEYLDKKYPGSLFIYSDRPFDSWLESCKKVYPLSHNYNHPLWKYPLDTFKYYYNTYRRTRLSYLSASFDHRDKVRGCLCQTYLIHDFTSDPSWAPICKLLQRPIPDIPFPNKDKVMRREEHDNDKDYNITYNNPAAICHEVPSANISWTSIPLNIDMF